MIGLRNENIKAKQSEKIQGCVREAREGEAQYEMMLAITILVTGDDENTCLIPDLKKKKKTLDKMILPLVLYCVTAA